MAKKSELKFEFEPNKLETFSKVLLITYKQQTFIDVYNLNDIGLSKTKRVDCKKLLEEFNLKLVEIKRVKLPKLSWSNR